MDENIREEEVAVTETEGGNEPMTLDDALAAARAEIEAREQNPEEMVAEEETVAAPEEGDASEEVVLPQMENPVPEQVVNPEMEALKAQIAQQNQMLMQYQQQNQQMQAQMQAMQESQNAAQTVAEAIMTPPVIDFGSIMYASEEEQRAAMDKFVNDTMNYTRQSVMNELKPMVDDFRAREAQTQRSNTKEKYRHEAQFSGFADRESWMDRVIEKNGLGNLPLDKQYEIAYLITRGVDAVNAERNPAPAPAPKTVDEMLQEVEGNPELMRALEAKRIKSIAQGQKDNPPPFVAGGGSNRIGLNVPDEPADFDMAREGAYNFLRGRR